MSASVTIDAAYDASSGTATQPSTGGSPQPPIWIHVTASRFSGTVSGVAAAVTITSTSVSTTPGFTTAITVRVRGVAAPSANVHTGAGATAPRLLVSPVYPESGPKIIDCSATTRPTVARTATATCAVRTVCSWMGTSTRIRRGTSIGASCSGTAALVRSVTSTRASVPNGLNSMSHSSTGRPVVLAS